MGSLHIDFLHESGGSIFDRASDRLFLLKAVTLHFSFHFRDATFANWRKGDFAVRKTLHSP